MKKREIGHMFAHGLMPRLYAGRWAGHKTFQPPFKKDLSQFLSE